MPDERSDPVAAAMRVEAKLEVMPVQILMRNYFSTYMLWASQDCASKAAAIERNHDGEGKIDIEHRAYVLSAVLHAAAFVEAMVNELFQDAADDYGVDGDGYIAPLGPRARELMREWWIASGGGFDRVLDKIQLLLVFAGAQKFDRGARPLQDMALVLSLRNALLHFKPESVVADVDHRFAKSLRGRFADNAMISGSGNAWWPDHALGAGCAQWAFDSAKATADAISTALGVEPNYRRHAATWFATS